MIAMALMTNPKLLIADEPTTALDVTIQSQILSLIQSIKEKIGLSVIFITHNLGIVAGMTDKVIVMYAGFIVEENETVALFQNPRHPYTAGLLQSVPRLDDVNRKSFSTIAGSPPNLINLPDACPFYPRCPRKTGQCTLKMPELKNYGGIGRAACYHPLEIV